MKKLIFAALLSVLYFGVVIVYYPSFLLAAIIGLFGTILLFGAIHLFILSDSE